MTNPDSSQTIAIWYDTETESPMMTPSPTPQQAQANPPTLSSAPPYDMRSPQTPQQNVANPPTPTSDNVATAPDTPHTKSPTPSPPPKNMRGSPIPQQIKGNSPSSPERVPVKDSSSHPPTMPQQSPAAIFEENKKHKLKQLSKMELQLKDTIDVYVKQKERYNKAVEERDATILERNEAQRELTKAEARFAEMLMLYEDVKNVATTVEKNCIILQKREEILVQTLQKREARKQSFHEMYYDVIERMQRDFENKIREKEAENVKLKAKIRMCEMKTAKLEGEITQVDRESESLRKLCEDLMKS